MDGAVELEDVVDSCLSGADMSIIEGEYIAVTANEFRS